MQLLSKTGSALLEHLPKLPRGGLLTHLPLYVGTLELPGGFPEAGVDGTDGVVDGSLGSIVTEVELVAVLARHPRPEAPRNLHQPLPAGTTAIGCSDDPMLKPHAHRKAYKLRYRLTNPLMLKRASIERLLGHSFVPEMAHVPKTHSDKNNVALPSMSTLQDQ